MRKTFAKLGLLILLFGLSSVPVRAEEGLAYVRHFEVPVPKKQAPKLIPTVLPEEISLRGIATEKLLLPIEADPAEAFEPDPVE